MVEDSTVWIVVGLLVAVAVLATLAQKAKVPYPILLVLGGLVLGFVPGLPRVELEPDLVFLLFLPPLLYFSALFTSWRDFKADLGNISLLAIGLVFATTCVVATVVHTAVDGMPWAASFALGAIVSPTDAVSATAIADRLGIPRRIVTILEGESLINDAAGLVTYQVAVLATVTGTFSLWKAGGQFVVEAAGGVLFGLLAGWIVVQARRHLSPDAPVQNVVSLLTPFVAYLPAESLNLSGVLAAVTVGLYLGRRATNAVSPETRLQGYGFWDFVTFLLNGVIFVLIGLQLPVVVEGVSTYSLPTLLFYGILTSLAVILARIAWVFLATYLPQWISRRPREHQPYPHPSLPLVVSWGGMRGVISLAAALALPLTVNGGAPFPKRDLILFLTFSVILTTLVLQGLSLPAMIRVLGVEDDGSGEREEAEGRVRAAEAALERLEDFAQEDWVNEKTLQRLQSLYTHRRNRFAARSGESSERDEYEERSAGYQRLMHELLGAQRQALIGLRDKGEIGDDALHAIERDLDLEESRLEF